MADDDGDHGRSLCIIYALCENDGYRDYGIYRIAIQAIKIACARTYI